MESAAQSKKKFVQIQLVLAICMGILIFSLRYGIFDQFEEGLWLAGIVFIEVMLGGVLVWTIFQFYQPKTTFSFNPIFIILSIGLIIGYSIYFIAQYLPWMDRASIYSIGLPFHLVGLFFIFWILFYEWWFLKNEMKKEYNTQRLLRLQDDLKNSEIKNIQQNIQPHFLFNSLNSINSLMLIDVDEAQKMIVQLSDFLRHSVLKNQKMFVNVEDELNQIERYFSIEKIRFSSRLNYSIECDVATKKEEIPAMVLQPLLENAIKFGLYGKLEQSEISIRFAKKDEALCVVIKNSFDPDMQPTSGTGFGLKSIRQKLYWIYAESNLLETNIHNNEFRVSVKIPLRKNESITN